MFNISNDMKIVRQLLNFTQEELASCLKVDIKTIKRIENEQTNASNKLLSSFYEFVYNKKIYLNEIKAMFYKEEINNDILLFHGAKQIIKEKLSIGKSKKYNDFGQGFYCGESYVQSASFVSNFEESCVYFYKFNPDDLKFLKYEVDKDWMLTIAYFRGTLDKYENHPIIKEIISKLNDIDYVIAPIADNRMFRIIDSFIEGEITDEQCKHCLAATNLGNQYVFLTQKAIDQLKELECCYLSSVEKANYKRVKEDDNKISEDKVKLARIQYRGKGQYIDEILK